MDFFVSESELTRKWSSVVERSNYIILLSRTKIRLPKHARKAEKKEFKTVIKEAREPRGARATLSNQLYILVYYEQHIRKRTFIKLILFFFKRFKKEAEEDCSEDMMREREKGHIFSASNGV